MAVTFKYRNHMNLSYAPGISIPGKDGPAGKKGTSGNSMYFVDFELNDSYSIDLALQKIENNKILTNDSNLDINSRPYKANDLLVSNSGNVYKIINSSGDTSKNYKFDIKFLGKLHKSVENDAVKMVIYDITGLVVENYKRQVKYYPARQKCCVPTNRCEKPVSGAAYENSDFYMYGTWIKPVLWAGTDMTTTSTPLDKRLKYSLILELHNEKKLTGVQIPGQSNSVDFKFNKILEFSAPGIAAMDSSISPQDVIFTDEFLLGLSGHAHSKYKTIYLSDMFMDKYHPFKNNIQCTLSADKSAWYKTGRESRTEDENKIDFPSLTLGDDAYYKDGDEVTDQTLCAKTLEDYTTGVSYYAVTGADASETINTDMFPQYSIGKALSSVSPQDIEEAVSNYDDTFILRENRNVDIDKSRVGDSAYFSSISVDSAFDTSTNGVLSNNVSHEIFDYIADDQNTYKLIVKKVEDKSITISEIAVEFNTTLFRDAYYRQYEQDGPYYRQTNYDLNFNLLEN